MSKKWIVLELSAPLMSFGGVMVDYYGPTRLFPSKSMLTGLFGNAMGWHWSEKEKHQSLQDRLIFGCRLDQEGSIITDQQNAKLEANDKGWTTLGAPEGREGASYQAPHRRFREFLADYIIQVVLTLVDKDEKPSLSDLAESLDRPKRPLFIGRKSCLPSRPLFKKYLDADNSYKALCKLGDSKQAQWPTDHGPTNKKVVEELADLRQWVYGIHQGSRRVTTGELP